MVDHRAEPPYIVHVQPLLLHTPKQGDFRGEIGSVPHDPCTLVPLGARNGRAEATLFQLRLQLLPGDLAEGWDGPRLSSESNSHVYMVGG